MLRNCATCGRLLTGPAGTPCPDCLAAETEALEKILAYLEAGGTPTMSAVIDGTRVPARLLRRLVQSGRIVLTGEGGACPLCGRAPRASGQRLCFDCARRIRAAAVGGPKRRGGQGAYHSRPLVSEPQQGSTPC